MNSLQKFLLDLGGLHDCRARIEFDTLKAKLLVEVDDLNANFKELPDYQGCASATIIFTGATILQMTVEVPGENFWIYDWKVVEESSNGGLAHIAFSPGGRIECRYRWAKVVSSTGEVLLQTPTMPT